MSNRDLWRYALKRDATIVTKDEDFPDMARARLLAADAAVHLARHATAPKDAAEGAHPVPATTT